MYLYQTYLLLFRVLGSNPRGSSGIARRGAGGIPRTGEETNLMKSLLGMMKLININSGKCVVFIPWLHILVMRFL